MRDGRLSSTNDRKLLLLKESIDGGRCNALLGAGVSMPAYPDWRGLIAQLIEEVGPPLEKSEQDSEPDVAQKLKDQSPAQYWDALRRIFDRRSCSRTAMRYHLLARIPFVSYVTMNYDPMLVDILTLHDATTFDQFEDGFLSPSDLQRRKSFKDVYYMHGRIDPDSLDGSVPSIVLERSSYAKAYDHEQSRLQTFLDVLLNDGDVCLLGCGLRDESMKGVMQRCKQIRDQYYQIDRPGKPVWFALLSDSKDDEIKAEELDAHGIEAVYYPRVDERYSGFDEVLRDLARASGPQRRTPPFHFGQEEGPQI